MSTWLHIYMSTCLHVYMSTCLHVYMSTSQKWRCISNLKPCWWWARPLSTCLHLKNKCVYRIWRPVGDESVLCLHVYISKTNMYTKSEALFVMSQTFVYMSTSQKRTCISNLKPCCWWARPLSTCLHLKNERVYRIWRPVGDEPDLCLHVYISKSDVYIESEALLVMSQTFDYIITSQLRILGALQSR